MSDEVGAAATGVLHDGDRTALHPSRCRVFRSNVQDKRAVLLPQKGETYAGMGVSCF